MLTRIKREDATRADRILRTLDLPALSFTLIGTKFCVVRPPVDPIQVAALNSNGIQVL